jgi:hypothetical protein
LRPRRGSFAAIPILGAVLSWTGGYLLSSRNSRCTDLVNAEACAGVFASDTWHGLGLGLLIGGIALLAGAALLALARRRSR